MEIDEVIDRIDNIPITEHYTDRSGTYIGMALTRWIDIKPIVMEILNEYKGKEKDNE